MISTYKLVNLLQDHHLRMIPEVATAPTLQRKIETANLPAVFVLPREGKHNYESTKTLNTDRQVDVLVYYSPVSQGELEDIQEGIYDLIDKFRDLYYNYPSLCSSVWIRPTATDSGLIILNMGADYYGFTYTIDIYLGDEGKL